MEAARRVRAAGAFAQDARASECAVEEPVSCGGWVGRWYLVVTTASRRRRRNGVRAMAAVGCDYELTFYAVEECFSFIFAKLIVLLQVTESLQKNII